MSGWAGWNWRGPGVPRAGIAPGGADPGGRRRGALFRINPFALASERDLDPNEAIDLLLHASRPRTVRDGLALELPQHAPAQSRASLAYALSVPRLFRCPECHNEYEAAMDDFIAIYFSISPQICSIRYHQPETLEPFDYMFVFKGVREGRTQAGELYLELGTIGTSGHRVSGARSQRQPDVRSDTRSLVGNQFGHRCRVRHSGRERGHDQSAAGSAYSSRQRISRREGPSGPWSCRARGHEPHLGPRGSRSPAEPSWVRGDIAELRSLPHRQAPAHEPDLQAPVPVGGRRRRAGPSDPGHRAPVHRHQGLDRARTSGSATSMPFSSCSSISIGSARPPCAMAAPS